MAKRLVLSVDVVEAVLLKSNPPKLAITARGWVSTSGWRDPTMELIDPKSELSPDGVLDFNFMAEPPTGIALQVLTPVAASFVWEQDAERVVAVRVVARTNERTEFLQQPTFTTLALGEETPTFPQRPFPWTSFPRSEESPTPPWGGEQFPTGPRGEHWPPTDPRIDDPIGPQWNSDGGVTDPAPWRSPFGRW